MDEEGEDLDLVLNVIPSQALSQDPRVAGLEHQVLEPRQTRPCRPVLFWTGQRAPAPSLPAGCGTQLANGPKPVLVFWAVKNASPVLSPGLCTHRYLSLLLIQPVVGMRPQARSLLTGTLDDSSFLGSSVVPTHREEPSSRSRLCTWGPPSPSAALIIAPHKQLML
jgi:hypothetical protein